MIELQLSINTSEKISKTLGENIFGEKETIRSIAKKVLERNHKILEVLLNKRIIKFTKRDFI